MAYSSNRKQGVKAPLPEKKIEKELSSLGKDLAYDLDMFSIDYLEDVANCILGKKPNYKYKQDLRLIIARSLDFGSQEAFDRFFSRLPEYLQVALQRGVFERFLDIRSLEVPDGKPLIVENTERHYFYKVLETNPDLRMGIFLVSNTFEIELSPVFGKVFFPWIPKPPAFRLQPRETNEGTPWSDNRQLAEIIPLLVEATAPIFKTKGRLEVARKGLLKGEIKALRDACALMPFPVATSYGIDPIELFVQVLAHLESKTAKRPEDGEAYIKALVDLFFFDTSATIHQSQGSGLEYFCLLKQFSHTPYAYSVEIKKQVRQGMVEMLRQMHAEGSWFSIEDLFQWFVSHGYVFDFYNEDIFTKVLYLRGDKLETEYGPVSAHHYDKGFHPKGIFRRMLFERPLFKAYCYLFAVLGLVEIGEKEVPLVLKKNGKMHPLTPYEGICSMKVTPFGAWCLGFVDKRPEAQKHNFETIADSNLLLVTFKGLSLERKLFLTQIGDPMGPERFKISEASFIRGCTSPAEIHSRIERFKKLIEPEPSERWITFFATLEQRSTLFAHGEAVLLYTFPDDPLIRKMFATEPAFIKILIKAEGNRVVIRKKDQKQFAKLLAEHGYLYSF